MKTLIVLLLSAIDTMLAARYPIEVFEIGETKDNQLYVKNKNEYYRHDGETKLEKLLKPYKQNTADQVAQDLVAKIKALRRDRSKSKVYTPEIYVLNGDLLNDNNDHSYGDYYDETDGFIDKTRVQKNKPDAAQNVIYHLLPQKRSNVYKLPRHVLRMEGRTAAPRHKYIYEKDY